MDTKTGKYRILTQRLSLRQLMLMTKIADCGSLKQAAAKTGMSQPRATKALQEIEDILEQQLFNRTNRGMHATMAGECVIRYAKAILTQAGNLQDELENLSKEHWSRIRIGTIMGAVPIVTHSVKAFLAKHPNTSFEIIEDTSIELFRLLDNGYIDLFIGRSSVASMPQLYNCFAFYEETLAVIAHPSHPLLSVEGLSLQDLSHSRWIVYTSQMPMRMSLEQEYRLEGIAFPKTLVETRSAFTTMALIQSDPNYIALLSKDVADFFIDSGMAKAMPFRLKSKSERYEIVTKLNITLSPAASEFMYDMIRSAS